MRICGLDVHKRFLVGVIFKVVISEQSYELRKLRGVKFDRSLESLHKLVMILHKYAVERVILESTGAYGLSVYYYLVESGFDVLMASPKDNRPIGQKKTDRVDAERLVRLYPSGNLRAYRLTTDRRIRELKELIRGRLELIDYRTKIKNLVMSILDRFFIDIKRVFSVFGKNAIVLVDGLARGKSLDEIVSASPILAKK